MIEELLSIPFYSIEDKKPLLVEYQRLFNITLCDTCTGSYQKAYQELKTYYYNLDMAKKKTDAPQKATKYKLVEGNTFYIAALPEPVTSENVTDKIIEDYFLKDSGLSKFVETVE